jgi:F-type H+-transporting ATPase subunit b
MRLRLSSFVSALSAFGLLLMSGTVRAAEHGADAHDTASSAAAEHAAEHGSSGLPQFNPEWFASQIFWLAITFLIFYVVMARFALPRVARVQSTRRSAIEKDITAAAESQMMAETTLTDYETAMLEARSKASALLNETALTAAASLASEQNRLAAELGARISAAEKTIEDARTKALADVRGAAADLAREMTTKFGGFHVTPAAAQKAVDQVAAI